MWHHLVNRSFNFEAKPAYRFGVVGVERILTGKKAHSNKTPPLTKSMNLGIWVNDTFMLYKRLLYWNNTFKKKNNKVITGKTPLFVIGPFRTAHSICLDIKFWQGNFVWKCYVSNLSTFNWKAVPQFFAKAFAFQKICFKVKALKTLKISADYHIKTCRSHLCSLCWL